MRRVILFVGAMLASAGTATAQPRPLAILVNGNNDCCTKDMGNLKAFLAGLDAEIIVTPWNALRDGGSQWDNALNDSLFLQELGNKVNSQPSGRPIILVGHSFGADSLLKAVGGYPNISARVTRRVDVFGVVDPVATWGRHVTNAGYYHVPSLVNRFLDRWQRQGWPPDNFLDSGNIGDCAASSCDQTEQVLQKNADGSIVTGGLFNQPKKTGHSPLARDAFVQQNLIDHVHAVVDGRKVVTLKSEGYGYYMAAEGGGGGVVNVNRTQAQQWERYQLVDVNGGALMSGDQVQLSTYTGHWLVAENSGGDVVKADRAAPFGWETFTIGKNEGGPIHSGDGVWLRCSNGTYVVVGSDLVARCQASFPPYAWRWIVEGNL